MAEITPEVWDDEFCHTMRLSPETVAAALADDEATIAELRTENARLQQAVKGLTEELNVALRQVDLLGARLNIAQEALIAMMDEGAG